MAQAQETPSANETAAPAEAAPMGPVEQLLDYLQDGGPVLLVLVFVSIIALTIILAKLFQFMMLRVSARGFIEPALASVESNRASEAIALLGGRRSPVARVMEVAVRETAFPGHSAEQVKEEIGRVAGLELDNLRSGLRALSLIATLSPLIGLLGTVLGMINAFQALEAAGNRIDPAILSGGIWVALLTTAAGLIIAIPAAAAHNWLEGVVYRVRRSMEDAVTRIFTARVGAPPEARPAE